MTRARFVLVLAAHLAVLQASSSACAQASVTLSFTGYLDRVLARNLDLAAARHDVGAAEARVQIGARLPDPTISGGLLSFDASHPTRSEQRTDVGTDGQLVCGYATGPGGAAVPCRSQLPAVVGAALDVPIELGDQQGRRMDVARVGVTQAGADVEDAIRVLRGQAASAWIDTLATQLAVERLGSTLRSLEALVEMNRARVEAGAIGDLELVQSRLEAQMFRGQVLTAEGSARAARLGLTALVVEEGGGEPTEIEARGTLELPPSSFDLAELVAEAMQNRSDLEHVRLGIDHARAARRLAEAQRWGTMDVTASWLYSTPGTDTQFGQTDYHAVGLMVGFPLPFRLLWSGEVDEANAMENAAEARYAQARQRIEVEIRQALARYEAAVRARALFDEGVLADADHVLEATRYQYEHGSANLVAVLVAQRMVNDVYAEYQAALAAHAHALVDLETAAGIWDVSFEAPPSP